VPFDGEHVDVYKGAQAAVIVFDLTRRETWAEVQSYVEDVPAGIPIMLLGNKRDAPDRSVDLEDMEAFASSATKARKSTVMCLETSMGNCYGLKALYSYLNIPYLELKLSIQAQALSATKSELGNTKEEFGMYVKAQSFDDFVRARSVTGGSSGASVMSPGGVKALSNNATAEAVSAASISTPTGPPTSVSKGPLSSASDSEEESLESIISSSGKGGKTKVGKEKGKEKEKKGGKEKKTEKAGNNNLDDLDSFAPGKTNLASFLGDASDEEDAGQRTKASKGVKQKAKHVEEEEEEEEEEDLQERIRRQRSEDEKVEREQAAAVAAETKRKAELESAKALSVKRAAEEEALKASAAKRAAEEEALAAKRKAEALIAEAAAKKAAAVDDFVPTTGGGLASGFLDDEEDEEGDGGRSPSTAAPSKSVTAVGSTTLSSFLDADDDDDDSGLLPASAPITDKVDPPPAPLPVAKKSAGVPSAAIAAALAAAAALKEEEDRIAAEEEANGGSSGKKKKKKKEKEKN